MHQSHYMEGFVLQGSSACQLWRDTATPLFCCLVCIPDNQSDIHPCQFVLESYRYTIPVHLHSPKLQCKAHSTGLHLCQGPFCDIFRACYRMADISADFRVTTQSEMQEKF